MSREFRACGEELYQLARAEILDEPSILEKLAPEVPSIRFIRDLLLARQLRERGNTPAALLLTKEVIRGSRDAGMPRYTREARLALAEILSETSGAEEAARIFAEELESSLSLDQIDILLPFSNAACRQLDGLIRCQIRMGKIADARETIHRAAMLKTEKCRQLLEKIRSQKHDRTHGLFAKTVLPLLEWDNQSPVKTDSLPGNATLIEFWPDGNEVFVWIDHQGSSEFAHLELGEWIQDVIPRLTGPLYQAGQILPPEPPAEMAAKLYTLLIEPVEGLIKTDRLLIIAHKELQSLPFEILLDRNGKLMIEKYCLSYLPGIHFLAGKGSVRKPSAEKGNYRHPPIMIIPDGFAAKRGPFQEMTSLRQTFPKLKIIGYPRNRNSLDASWIHLSSHLKVDRRYWLNSTFHAAGSSFPMTRLLAVQTDCRLLSLGSCEPANSATGASPYWMGYSEILLLNGAESLLASRWRMDELSSPVYTEFFRLCRKGLPMDEALRISKLKFLHPGKNSLPVHARHPFYWSGITYVGKPGQRLYPTADAPSGATAAPLILWLVILAGVMLRDEIVAAKKAVLTKK